MLRVCFRSGRARFTPLDRLDRLYVGPRIDSYRSNRFKVGPRSDSDRLDRLLREAEFRPTGSDVGYPIGPLSETGNLADDSCSTITCFTSPTKFSIKVGRIGQWM